MVTHDNPGEPSPAPTSASAPGPTPRGFKPARTWKTVHLVLVALAALLLGMRMGYDGPSSAVASTGSAASGGGLPPAPGGESTTTTSTPPTGGAGTEPAQPEGEGTEPAPADGEGTDVDGDPLPGDPTEPIESSDAPEAGGPARAAAGAGAAPQLLLDVAPRTGGMTTAAFTVAAGGWQMGWSFTCRGREGTFRVEARRADGSAIPDGPVLDRTGADGNGVETYATDGGHVLTVTTDCLWAAKVTGVAA